MDIYTIGFTQTTARDFFGRLRDAGIERLLDVRLNNRSQLAGFASETIWSSPFGARERRLRARAAARPQPGDTRRVQEAEEHALERIRASVLGAGGATPARSRPETGRH